MFFQWIIIDTLSCIFLWNKTILSLKSYIIYIYGYHINIIPSQILQTVLDCMPRLFFRLKYVWFPVHLGADLIPNSSGQLAELIVHIIPLE